MTHSPKPRAVVARRMLTLATAATTAAIGVSATAGTQDNLASALTDDHIVLAQAAEGEGGEGGGADGNTAQGLQRDLSFMEGHLRAGLALYEIGDLAAAKTHMGHPIEEKYDAVADPLEDRGFGQLRESIVAIAAASEAEAPFDEVKAAFDTARATIEEVRATMPVRDQILGLVQLTRVAGEEYAVAVEGGTISNLHEYQDSWGFLQVVQTELEEFAAGGDADVAGVAADSLDALRATSAAFGDIQGKGDFALDPSLMYGAAAKIELDALELD